MTGDYATLGDLLGQIVEEKGDVMTLEFRPDIKVWRYTSPGGGETAPFDQPPIEGIARYHSLWVGRRVEVLQVSLEGERLQVTVRRL